MTEQFSRSEKLIEQRASASPIITPHAAKSVSQFRRETLGDEVNRGNYRESANTYPSNMPGRQNDMFSSTAAGNVISNQRGLKKFANEGGGGGVGGGSGGYRGSGGTVRQTPEIYSPLWLNSNLNLPRDRATINAWSRSFFALNPIVQNAISLHSTYPISKLSIKCKNEKVEQFFANMIEEIDLMNICCQIAQEYWILGESFIYAELDQRTAKWSRLIIQNPDYITVKHSVIAGEPIISLRPDENLKRIVTSNRPADIQQRQGLSPEITEHVRRGENIPLSNFYVSHLARKISPYETRGTGLVVSCFRDLMLFDMLRESKYAQASNMINPLTLIKIGSADYKPTPADLESWREVFECHDEETEVLTDQGFKKFNEVINYTETDGKLSNISPVSNIKIACFNAENEQLEYHTPIGASLYNYDGDMYHLSNKKIDIKVTPNHKMWVSKRKNIKNTKHSWEPWEKITAENINYKNYYKTRSCANWTGEEKQYITICNTEVPVELYLEFLGYLISEGCVYKSSRNYFTSFCQSTKTTKNYYLKMKNCFEQFAKTLNKSFSSEIEKNGMWVGSISCKELYEYFKENIGNKEENTYSENKRVPKNILNLSSRLLKIFLTAAMDGDGHRSNTRIRKLKFNSYTTVSKQLADDIYEIAFKCGYSPILSYQDRKSNLWNLQRAYKINWAEKNIYSKGFFPSIHTGCGSKDKELLKIEKYSGKIWCFEVPTGLFITRREGKITIQGNSAQYDKDFKIFTHEAVTVEKIGNNSAILDINPDITQLLKEIYIGLMVPAVLMDGGGEVTYANGGITLDVLRQRYMQFRNMLTAWLRRKIFAPISKINDFYDYKDNKKVLIVPDIDWNHMSLFDMGDYIQNMKELTADPKRVSVQTLYRSLGLDWEDEKRKIKIEAIHEAILNKEKEALTYLPLEELRALGPDDEIKEKIQLIPGADDPYTQPPGVGAPEGAAGGVSAPPGMEIPSMPPSTPTAPGA